MKPAQFSLREMLLATLACAMLVAIAAPFLRQFPIERLVWTGAAFTAAACAFLLVFVPFALKRQRLAAAAGKPLAQAGRWPRTARVALACGEVLLIALAALPALFIPPLQALPGAQSFAWLFNIEPVLLAAMFGMGAAQSCRYAWSHRFELCENGVIVYRRGFFPWEQVRSYSWGSARNRLNLTVGRLPKRRIHAKIRPRMHDAVESLLAAKIVRPAGRGADFGAGEELPPDPMPSDSLPARAVQDQASRTGPA